VKSLLTLKILSITGQECTYEKINHGREGKPGHEFNEAFEPFFQISKVFSKKQAENLYLFFSLTG
jgi:hypothetical protein